MWAPGRKAVGRGRCSVCGRSIEFAEARRCMACGRVVCIKCFDVSIGVCGTCAPKFAKDTRCPEYIC